MTIDQFNFAGKKAFVRVDFNVPLDENFNITDHKTEFTSDEIEAIERVLKG